MWTRRVELPLIVLFDITLFTGHYYSRVLYIRGSNRYVNVASAQSRSRYMLAVNYLYTTRAGAWSLSHMNLWATTIVQEPTEFLLVKIFRGLEFSHHLHTR